MTLIAFSLFGVLMAAGVISAWWSGRSAASLLASTFVRGLLTVAVAAALAVWQVRAAFEGIAHTGSGGIGTIIPPLADAMTLLRVGVVFAVILLALGLVLSWKSSSTAAPLVSKWSPAATVAVLVVLAAGVGAAMWGAERSVGLPAAHLGRLTAATTPPPEYAWALSEPGQQFVGEAEIIQPTLQGSAALVVVLTVALFVVGRRERFSTAAFASNLTRAVVIAALTVSAWYAVHLGPMTSWVRDLAERLG